MNRSQRRIHVAVWAVLLVTIATIIVGALVVSARVDRAVASQPTVGTR